MAVKDIRLILHDGDSAAAAIDLSRRLRARIRAIVVEEQAELTDYYDEARATIRARVMAARNHFENLAERANISFSVAAVTVPPNRSYSAVLDACRFADLVVVEQSSSAAADGPRLVRRLLAESPAPLIVLPRSDSPRYDRAALIWDGRSAVAGAVAAAVPVLRMTQAISLFGVGTSGQARMRDLAELANHLRGLGINAELSATEPQHSMTEILAGAAKAQIDLVTLIGFGVGRIREFFLGDPVRRILSRARVPVLIRQ
jgi:nucleotide-binding universal stress UspA family protein